MARKAKKPERPPTYHDGDPVQNKSGPHWFNGRRVIFLYVPYAERERAKALGARWFPGKRMWWITADMDRGPFLAWLPPQDQPGAMIGLPPGYSEMTADV